MSESRILDRRSVLRGRVLDIGVERIALPGGRETEMEILRHPGAAAIVALTPEDEVLLVRQYRHAAGAYLWEVPAGTCEQGEAPQRCARRELEDEAGVRAATWVALGEMLPAPGYSDERIHLFAARDLQEAKQQLDDDELITEVEAIPFDEAWAWAAQGRINDAKTVVALCRARLRGVLRGGASA